MLQPIYRKVEVIPQALLIYIRGGTTTPPPSTATGVSTGSSGDDPGNERDS